MKPSTGTGKKSILLKIAEKLLQAQQELDALLNSGKVATQDLFEVQKKKILKAIAEIENRIKLKRPKKRLMTLVRRFPWLTSISKKK